MPIVRVSFALSSCMYSRFDLSFPRAAHEARAGPAHAHVDDPVLRALRLARHCRGEPQPASVGLVAACACRGQAHGGAQRRARREEDGGVLCARPRDPLGGRARTGARGAVPVGPWAGGGICAIGRRGEALAQGVRDAIHARGSCSKTRMHMYVGSTCMCVMPFLASVPRLD